MGSNDPSLTKRRTRRALRWIIGVVGLAGLIQLVGFLYLRYAVTRDYKDAVAEADRVEPGGWRMEDLEARRAVLPDEVNGAVRVAHVADALPPGWAARDGRSPPGFLDATGAPLQGQALLKALKSDRPNFLLTKERAEGVAVECKRLNQAIVLARDLVRYPSGRFKIEWRPNPFDIPLTPVGQARSVQRLLDLDALARSQSGDSGGALDSCLAMLNAARSLGDTPLESFQMTRGFITRASVDAVDRTLARGEPGDQALARLQGAFAAESDVPFALYALRAERAFAFQTLESLEKGAFALDETGLGWRLVSSGPQGHLMYAYNKGLTLEFYTRAVEIARRPVPEQLPLWSQWDNDLTARKKSRLARPFGALTFMTMPALPYINSSAIQTGNMAGLCAVMVAAERYRHAKGSWPDSAEAIERALGIKLPLDPWLIAPYHLKRTEDGLIVYSVGSDHHDDGGMFGDPLSFRIKTDVCVKLWNVAKRRRQPSEAVENAESR
jgi:hypothetical protein